MYVVLLSGSVPEVMYPIPPEEKDTPRTYRSEGDPYCGPMKKEKEKEPPKKETKKMAGGKRGQPKEEEPEFLTPEQAKQMLTKTFMYFQRAVVCILLLGLCYCMKHVFIKDRKLNKWPSLFLKNFRLKAYISCNSNSLLFACFALLYHSLQIKYN